jgi:hypothetical protein
MIAFIKRFLDYINNITIIISNNNIYSLSDLTIIKYNDNKNLVFYYISSNIFNSTYLYILFGYLFNINIIYIDCLPNNINNLMYIIKLTKSKINIELVDNFFYLSNNKFLMDKYPNLFKYSNKIIYDNKSLLYGQNYYFDTIKSSYIKYINYNFNIDDLLLINGLNIYFNHKNFNDYNFWDLSFEGQIALNIFINEGKKI